MLLKSCSCTLDHIYVFLCVFYIFFVGVPKIWLPQTIGPSAFQVAISVTLKMQEPTAFYGNAPKHTNTIHISRMLVLWLWCFHHEFKVFIVFLFMCFRGCYNIYNQDFCESSGGLASKYWYIPLLWWTMESINYVADWEVTDWPVYLWIITQMIAN